MRLHYAMLPGSFDPPTNGHIDIIERIASLYEKLYVVIAENHAKTALFSAEERKSMLDQIFVAHKNIEVVIWDSLVVDFARKYNVGVMIRGVRALSDFSYEFELAETNKLLCPEIEVLFIPTNPKYFLLRSSSIKELAAFGADIDSMVPKLVADIIKERFAKRK